MSHERARVSAARERIERELRERLAMGRPVERVPVRSAVRSLPIAAIALGCTTCRRVSAADARFCTHCGTRFNAQIVAHEAAGSVDAERWE